VMLLIDAALPTGGAERFTVGLATHLPKDRLEVWLCSTRWIDPAVRERLAQAGVGHLHLGRSGKLDVHRFAALARLLARERFDVLHAQKFGSNVWGMLIGRACGVPTLIAQEHSWSYRGEPLRRWLDGHVIGVLADRVVAVSTRDAARMASLEGIPAAKIVTIPAAYVPHGDRGARDLRAELGLAADTPLVGTVAVLRPEKALEVLIAAHALLVGTLPEARLIIAGDGPCRSALAERARAAGILDRVHFLGVRSDVDALLGALDVGAICSDREGTPLMALECFANGTPLVATDVGGIPDLVKDGVNGLLVAPRDPRALADAILALLRDPARAAALAQAARSRLEQFRIERIAERFACLYEELAGAAR
jgi:glycosyltransferase involved in cell wall biosynthesis